MYLSSALLVGLVSFTLALQDATPAQLVRRQTLERLPCSEVGEKPCGDGCIALNKICCPNQINTCDIGKYCITGSNGLPGCCDLGTLCQGPGGVIPGTTNIITVPGSTSTTFIELPGFTSLFSSATTILIPGGGGGTIVTTLTSATTYTSASTTTYTVLSETTDVVNVPLPTETAPAAPTTPPVVAPPPNNATVTTPPSPSVTILTAGQGPVAGGFGRVQLAWSVIGQFLAAMFFL